MQYEELTLYDIRHNPPKVQCIVTDNAHHFYNDLYTLADGNHFEFDADTLKALDSLKSKIENILEKGLTKWRNCGKINTSNKERGNKKNESIRICKFG